MVSMEAHTRLSISFKRSREAKYFLPEEMPLKENFPEDSKVMVWFSTSVNVSDVKVRQIDFQKQCILGLSP